MGSVPLSLETIMQFPLTSHLTWKYDFCLIVQIWIFILIKIGVKILSKDYNILIIM